VLCTFAAKQRSDHCVQEKLLFIFLMDFHESSPSGRRVIKCSPQIDEVSDFTVRKSLPGYGYLKHSLVRTNGTL
jgi:hypothetical protein